MSRRSGGAVPVGGPALVTAAVVVAVLTGCAPSSGDQSGLQVSGLSVSPSPTGSTSASAASGTASPGAVVSGAVVSGAATPSRASGAASTLSAPSAGAVAGGAVMPPAVPGYSYLDPPATATAAFSKLAGAYPGVFGVPVVRAVKQENNSVGTVGFLPLSSAAAAAGSEDSVVQGLVTGMSGKGYTVSTQQVGGHRLVLATSKQGTIVAWFRDGVVAVVTSTNPPPRPLAFATAALT